MNQRRNDEGFRNQQQGGGQPGAGQQGGQFGGRPDQQHSQFSGSSGSSQYGSTPFGGQQPGNPYGNPYAPSTGADQPENYNEQQFRDHYGAAGDPYRGGEPQRSYYGSQGFGATGHGGLGYSGLGAFDAGYRQDNSNFSQQQFDQFGREQFGQRAPSQSSRPQPHEDPHYRQWREEQMRRFDEDYRQWHQERYQNFSKDFDDWRARNTQARASSGAAAGGESSDLTSQDTKGNKGGNK